MLTVNPTRDLERLLGERLRVRVTALHIVHSLEKIQ